MIKVGTLLVENGYTSRNADGGLREIRIREPEQDSRIGTEDYLALIHQVLWNLV